VAGTGVRQTGTKLSLDCLIINNLRMASEAVVFSNLKQQAEQVILTCIKKHFGNQREYSATAVATWIS
jgi:hypothetical protein